MTFSLSRCHTKKASSRDLPTAASKSLAKSSIARRRKLLCPPIPCYKEYSKLERMEDEFLRQIDKEPRCVKENLPIPVSRRSSSFPSFSSSEEEYDDALLDPVFSKSKLSDSISTSLQKKNSPGCEAEIRNETNEGLPLKSTALCTTSTLRSHDVKGHNAGQCATPPTNQFLEKDPNGNERMSVDDEQPAGSIAVILEASKDNESGATETTLLLPGPTKGSSTAIAPSSTLHLGLNEISAVNCASVGSQTRRAIEAIPDPDQPDRDDLQFIKDQTDAVFCTTDMQTSLKDFLGHLKAKLGRTLTVTEKKWTKAYLKELVNRRLRRPQESNNIPKPITAPKITETGEGESQALDDVRVKKDGTKLSSGVSGSIDTSDPQQSNAETVRSSVRTIEPPEELPFCNRRGCDAVPNESATTGNVTNSNPAHLPTNTVRITNQLEVRGVAVDEEEHCTLLKSLPKRLKRKRPLKTDPSPEKENVPNRQGRSQSAKETKNTTRKWARKGTCALCTTCPCSKSLDTSDKNCDVAFARSDVAVEKALIRRVQKMEKTCELDELRLETVRRKLKQHRREIWKKKEKARTMLNEATPYRFLPEAADAEVMSEMRCNLLPMEVVNNAQKMIFPVIPYVQVTLTQLMGGSKNKKKAGDSEESLLEDEGLATIPEEIDEDISEEGACQIIGSEEEVYMEYSKDVEYQDRIQRTEWNKTQFYAGNVGVDNCSILNLLSKEKAREAFSVPLSQNSVWITDENPSHCSWDMLFQDDESPRCEDNGIGQLAGLFDGSDLDANAGSCELENCASLSVQLSALSQTSEAKAAELITSIEKNSAKLVSLEKLCPNWKENVAFAMMQKDEVELTAALEKVRLKRAQMLEYKRRIVEAWEMQDVVLEVFAKGLRSSLGLTIPSE